VSSLGLHLVWCPKYPDNDLAIVARELMPDRADRLARVAPADAFAGVVRTFKARSTRILRQNFAWLGRRRALWSKSYFAASVGYALEHTLRRYIEHQWDEAA
jgi:putative transposase